mgnify:CR=1 FL=1
MSNLFIHATLKIRIGGYDKFAKAMAKQVPIAESYGWKLRAAFVTMVGRVYTAPHIW